MREVGFKAQQVSVYWRSRRVDHGAKRLPEKSECRSSSPPSVRAGRARADRFRGHVAPPSRDASSWIREKAEHADQGHGPGSPAARRHRQAQRALRILESEVRIDLRQRGAGLESRFLLEFAAPAESRTGNAPRAFAPHRGRFRRRKAFAEAFRAAALGVVGSGWVWLVVDAGLLRIVGTANADTPIAHGLTPLLVIDVREYA